MKKKQLTPNRVIVTFALFFLLTIDTGFYSSERMSGTIRLIISIAAVGLIIITRLQKTILSNPFFSRLNRTFLFFVLSLILPVIYGNFNTKQMIVTLVPWVVGYLFTLFVSYQEFKDAFLSIVRFLAVYSLITFFLGIILPDLITVLPSIEKNGTLYYNTVFSVVSNSLFVSRNFGIFWEPGAFSIFLNVALYFELFENKFNAKHILLLSVTILTTVSTLGIVCMVILFAAFLTTDKYVSSSRIKSLIVTAGALGLVVLIFYGGDFIYNTFNKLDMSGTTINESTAVRMNAIIYPGSAFLENPIFGVGYDDYLFIQERFCGGMATCSFINWLCLFGILGGIIPVVGCIRFFTINNHNFLANCALFIFTMFLFSTENFIQIIFIYILMFFGYNKRNNNSFLKKLV
ncbi:MAG: hypothetical protein E7557_00505 [Ruminococcaceae bacterium]|nr:hypothetical protein [Oscillospiraceae bacterium]